MNRCTTTQSALFAFLSLYFDQDYISYPIVATNSRPQSATALFQHFLHFIADVTLNNDFILARGIFGYARSSSKLLRKEFRSLFQIDIECFQAVNSCDVLSLVPFNSLNRDLGGCTLLGR